MRFLKTLAVFAVISAAGCTHLRFTWSKPGGTYDQYLSDRFECFKQSPSRSEPDKINPLLFKACMTARGWRQDPNGYGPPG